MSTKRRQTPRTTPSQQAVIASARAANVIDLRMRVLPRHLQILTRWLDAGRTMGLCDAAPYRPEAADTGSSDYVLIWVRENADPAYKVAPEGMHWTITDTIRNEMLARVGSFEEALTIIRPVLPATSAVA